MEKTFMKATGIYSLCLILMGTLLVGTPLGAIAADTIKIGMVEAKSGPLEYTGRFYLAAAQFAVDEQNEKGGLFGKKIEIISEDGEWKPDVSTRKAKKLIMEDNVDFFVSGSGSANSIALNKVAENYKKIFINTSGTADDVQGRAFSRYGFRTCNSSYNIIAAQMHFLATSPYRRYYIIGPDFVYTYALSKVGKELMKIHIPDAKIVGEDFHPMGTKDFGPYITKIIAAKPDIILSGGFGNDLINMIKTARAMGLKSPFPIITQMGEPYPMRELQEDAVGLIITQQYSLRVKTPENEAFIRKWHEKHKNDKDFLTWFPHGYCGAGVFGWRMTLAAIEKAGSLDPEKIIEAYEGFQYKSPVGLWTMRKCDHSVIIPMYVSKVESGWNPFFNGSIRADVKFPWEGPNIQMLPAEQVNAPATPDYNPRCP
jgi:branched-chain amino acid transport system substrate-binding protein